MASIFDKLKTYGDYQREEEEFQINKRLKQAQADAWMARAKSPGGGGNTPAAMQMTDNYIKNLEASGKVVSPLEKNNILAQFAKTVERGVVNSPDGGYMSAPGYDELLANRKSLEKGQGRQAEKDVDLTMNPQIAADTKQAERNIEISTAADLEKQKNLGAGNITDVQKKATGQTQFSTVLNSMRGEYDKLNELKAIPSSKYTPFDNLSISARASGLGQAIGSATATPEQVIRGNIKNMIPRLMTAISGASGMSAKQLDSVPEMKLMKESISDPTQPIETVIKTLNDLESLYGLNNAENVPMGGKVYPAEAAAAKLDATPQKLDASKIPMNAAQALKSDPRLSEQFDMKYGPGASKMVLGK